MPAGLLPRHAALLLRPAAQHAHDCVQASARSNGLSTRGSAALSAYVQPARAAAHKSSCTMLPHLPRSNSGWPSGSTGGSPSLQQRAASQSAAVACRLETPESRCSARPMQPWGPRPPGPARGCCAVHAVLCMMRCACCCCRGDSCHAMQRPDHSSRRLLSRFYARRCLFTRQRWADCVQLHHKLPACSPPSGSSFGDDNFDVCGPSDAGFHVDVPIQQGHTYFIAVVSAPIRGVSAPVRGAVGGTTSTVDTCHRLVGPCDQALCAACLTRAALPPSLTLPPCPAGSLQPAA